MSATAIRNPPTFRPTHTTQVGNAERRPAAQPPSRCPRCPGHSTQDTFQDNTATQQQQPVQAQSKKKAMLQQLMEQLQQLIGQLGQQQQQPPQQATPQ